MYPYTSLALGIAYGVLIIRAILLIIKAATMSIELSNSSGKGTQSHLTAHFFLKRVGTSIDTTMKISKC